MKRMVVHIHSVAVALAGDLFAWVKKSCYMTFPVTKERYTKLSSSKRTLNKIYLCYFISNCTLSTFGLYDIARYQLAREKQVANLQNFLQNESLFDFSRFFSKVISGNLFNTDSNVKNQQRRGIKLCIYPPPPPSGKFKSGRKISNINCKAETSIPC